MSNTALVFPSNEGPSSARLVIDSKAMRKIRESDLLVGVMETTGELGASNVQCQLNTRFLSKLA